MRICADWSVEMFDLTTKIRFQDGGWSRKSPQSCDFHDLLAFGGR